MHRRQLLWLGAGAAAAAASRPWSGEELTRSECSLATPPAYSVIPVVGDGRWIWTKPPVERGYLEPRPYLLKVGVSMEGIGRATNITATTPVPVAYPEQKINGVEFKVDGCEATVRQLAAGASQLIVSAAEIVKGQTITAVAEFNITLYKQFHGFVREQFPKQQSPPSDVKKAALQDSPGIQTSAKSVRDLATKLAGSTSHPWDAALAFARWIPENIRPQLGSYTSVATALETKHGDCEEMAGVFVALCRAVNIPARLVWVPNHAWAEFYLTDDQNRGHWIPAHTACYSWFGWTGAHELVLQKGDRLYVPEQHKQLRLMEDWMQWSGRKPRTMYTAELIPLAGEDNSDPGPGARSKAPSGEWKLTGSHADEKHMRR